MEFLHKKKLRRIGTRNPYPPRVSRFRFIGCRPIINGRDFPQQGRFKVRNPRLFNPTSMRRRPDIVKPHIGERGSVGTANSTTVGKDGAVVTSGVTLLLGRRADGGSPEGEHVGEEQVGGKPRMRVFRMTEGYRIGSSTLDVRE